MTHRRKGRLLRAIGLSGALGCQLFAGCAPGAPSEQARGKRSLEAAARLHEQLTIGTEGSVTVVGTGNHVTFGMEAQFDALSEYHARHIYPAWMEVMTFSGDALRACLEGQNGAADFWRMLVFEAGNVDGAPTPTGGDFEPAWQREWHELPVKRYPKVPMGELLNEDKLRGHVDSILEHSRGAPWGYRAPTEPDRVHARPLAQTSRSFVRSTAVGMSPGQKRPVNGHAGVGLSPAAAILGGSVCELALQSQNWVPMPGLPEMFFSNRSLTWEYWRDQAKYPYRDASVELHAEPMTSFSRATGYRALHRFMKERARDDLEQRFGPSLQPWVVADSANIELNDEGLHWFLRIAQAYLVLQSFLVAPVLPLESGHHIFATVDTYPSADWVFDLSGKSKANVYEGPKETALRVYLNPFAPQRTSLEGAMRRGDSLDFAHIGIEVRRGGENDEVVEHLLPAAAVRFATGAFGDYRKAASAGSELIPAALSPRSAAPSSEASGFPGPDSQPSNKKRERIMAFFRAAQTLAYKDRDTHRIIALTAPTLAHVAPLWSWDALPCYADEDERDRVRKASVAWINSVAITIRHAVRSERGLILPEMYWHTYKTWAQASGLSQVLQRCLAPREDAACSREL